MDERVPNIPREPASKSQDFFRLREDGIRQLEALTGLVWTDYNAHDPGITILEAACYALTELSLRASLDIKDITKRVDGELSRDLFGPEDILPSAPWTIDDYRKLLTDHPLVRNAWLQVNTVSEQAVYVDTDTQDLTFVVQEDIILSGLYNLILELENTEETFGNLNNGILPRSIDVSGNNIDIQVSLPFWDDDDVLPDWAMDLAFLNPVTIVNPLQVLTPDDLEDYAVQLQLDYTLPDGTNSFRVIGMGITVLTSLPPGVSQNDLEAALVLELTTLGNNSNADITFWKTYNRKIMAAHMAVAEIRKYFLDHRNLAEDIVQIKAARVQEIAVNAQIILSANANITEVLARMFWQLEQFIDPEIIFQGIEGLQAAGVPPDEMFEGPLLRNGFIEDASLQSNLRNSIIYTSDLLRVMLNRSSVLFSTDQNSTIENQDVIAIQNLTVTNIIDNQEVTENVRNCLKLFQTDLYRPVFSPEKSQIQVRQGNLVVNWSLDDALARLESLRNEALQHAVENIAQTLSLPQGTPLQLSDYYSIQHELPVVYGVGRGTLALESSPARHAQARQLKAYLLLFEQLMADSAVQLETIKDFFSFRTPVGDTYQTQALTDVPDIFDLVVPGYENAADLQSLREIRNGERQGRLLDHLSGRLSEDLRAQARWMFNAGRNEEWRNDQHLFLSGYPDSSQKRGLAYNYLGRDRQSAFQIFIDDSDPLNLLYSWNLTGFWGDVLLQGVNIHTSPGAVNEEIQLVKDIGRYPDFYAVENAGAILTAIQLFDTSGGGGTLLAETTRDYENDLTALFPWTRERTRIVNFLRDVWDTDMLSGFEKRVSSLLGLKNFLRRRLYNPLEAFVLIPAIAPFTFTIFDYNGEILLTSTPFADAVAALDAAGHAISRGLSLSNYALDAVTNAPDALLFLDLETGPLLINTFSDVESAENFRDRIIGFLQAAYGGEGFHVVEHILLRPRDAVSNDVLLATQKDNNGIIMEGERDPYSARISVLAPDWPVRFADPAFRSLFIDILIKEAPAHLAVDIYFLDQETMEDFENLYYEWLFQANEPSPDPAALRTALINLVSVLNDIRLSI